MINREQIEEMIGCYGADVARWPCDNKKAITAFIEKDKVLSEALFMAQQLDQSVNELLVSAEADWSSPAAEINLIEKIERSTKADKGIWKGLAGFYEQVKLLMTTPLYPVGVTALILLVLFQFNDQSPPFFLEADNNSDLVVELDDWLIYEGLIFDDAPLLGQVSEGVTFAEEAGVGEQGPFEAEMIFFL